jgi:hypothetical protein
MGFKDIGFVLGDLLVLPPGGCIMSCDAVLLTGTAIVNEAMLTGKITVMQTLLQYLRVRILLLYIPVLASLFTYRYASCHRKVLLV